MGHYAKKRHQYNLDNNVKFNAEELLKDVKEGRILPVKLTKEQQKRIKQYEIKEYKFKYCGKGSNGELPDYLKPFKEPVPMANVKKIAKQILDGTYDN